jgi:hypothetical protein
VTHHFISYRFLPAILETDISGSSLSAEDPRLLAESLLDCIFPLDRLLRRDPAVVFGPTAASGIFADFISRRRSRSPDLEQLPLEDPLPISIDEKGRNIK